MIKPGACPTSCTDCYNAFSNWSQVPGRILPRVIRKICILASSNAHDECAARANERAPSQLVHQGTLLARFAAASAASVEISLPASFAK